MLKADIPCATAPPTYAHDACDALNGGERQRTMASSPELPEGWEFPMVSLDICNTIEWTVNIPRGSFGCISRAAYVSEPQAAVKTITVGTAGMEKTAASASLRESSLLYRLRTHHHICKLSPEMSEDRMVTTLRQLEDKWQAVGHYACRYSLSPPLKKLHASVADAKDMARKLLDALRDPRSIEGAVAGTCGVDGVDAATATRAKELTACCSQSLRLLQTSVERAIEALHHRDGKPDGVPLPDDAVAARMSTLDVVMGLLRDLNARFTAKHAYAMERNVVRTLCASAAQCAIMQLHLMALYARHTPKVCVAMGEA